MVKIKGLPGARVRVPAKYSFPGAMATYWFLAVLQRPFCYKCDLAVWWWERGGLTYDGYGYHWDCVRWKEGR